MRVGRRRRGSAARRGRTAGPGRRCPNAPSGSRQHLSARPATTVAPGRPSAATLASQHLPHARRRTPPASPLRRRARAVPGRRRRCRRTGRAPSGPRRPPGRPAGLPARTPAPRGPARTSGRTSRPGGTASRRPPADSADDPRVIPSPGRRRAPRRAGGRARRRARGWRVRSGSAATIVAASARAATQQLLVAQQVEQLQRAAASGLGGAQHVALTALPQVELGQLGAVEGLRRRPRPARGTGFPPAHPCAAGTSRRRSPGRPGRAAGAAGRRRTGRRRGSP